VLNKKILHCTHSDLDGFGCMVLGKYFPVNATETLVMDYSDYNEDSSFNYDQLKGYDKIIFTDFSPNDKVRAIIEEENCECLILDHHIGVQEEIEEWTYEKKDYFFNNEECGTLLFLNYLTAVYPDTTVSNSLIDFVNLVDTYDLWKEKSPFWDDAKGLSILLFKHISYSKEGYDKYEWYLSVTLKKLANNPNNFFYSPVEIQKLKADKIKENKLFNDVCKKLLLRKDAEGNYFVIFKARSKISFLASRLLNKYTKVKYAIVINTWESDLWKLSVRTKDDRNLNLLDFENCAGHELACGVKDVSQEYIKDLWSGKVHHLNKANKEKE